MKTTLKILFALALTSPHAYAACTVNQPDPASMQGAWLALAGPNVMHMMELSDFSAVNETLYFGSSESRLKGRWTLLRTAPEADDLVAARYHLEIRQRSGHVSKSRILSYDCNQIILQDSYGKVRTYARVSAPVQVTTSLPAAVSASPSFGQPSQRSAGSSAQGLSQGGAAIDPAQANELLRQYRQNPSSPEVRAAIRNLSPEQRRALFQRLATQ